MKSFPFVFTEKMAPTNIQVYLWNRRPVHLFKTIEKIPLLRQYREFDKFFDVILISKLAYLWCFQDTFRIEGIHICLLALLLRQTANIWMISKINRWMRWYIIPLSLPQNLVSGDIQHRNPASFQFSALRFEIDLWFVLWRLLLSKDQECFGLAISFLCH